MPGGRLSACFRREGGVDIADETFATVIGASFSLQDEEPSTFMREYQVGEAACSITFQVSPILLFFEGV
jgi:hypothetical protein